MYRNFFKEYFSFSLAARRAIWILIILIIVAFSLPYLYSILYREKNELPGNEEFKRFDRAWIVIKETEKSVVGSTSDIKPFDPNKFTAKEWIKAGVKKNVAEKIEKYIKKGGRFKRKQDLLKIYGFEKNTYNRLSPYIVIPSDYIKKIPVKINKNEKNGNYVDTVKRINFVVELNSADSNVFEKILSKNRFLSTRIIKYRHTLGGFYRREQLMEVYGFRRNIFDSIKYMVKVDTSLITKINLNEVNEKQLAKHPYIGKYKASEIIKYRKFKNKISNCNELVENGFFTKEEINKLKHYLKF